MNPILLVFLMIAGAFGVLARYFFTEMVNKYFFIPYAWGTSLVNILGCFLFGLLIVCCTKFGLPDSFRLVILTGFMGSFTTFSTMMFEMNTLIGQDILLAIVFIVIQIVIGFIALKCGLAFG